MSSDFDIFNNAPEDATPAELAAYLDEACGDDAELRARVETLLVTEERTDDFLEKAPLHEISDAPTLGPEGAVSKTPTPLRTPGGGTASARCGRKAGCPGSPSGQKAPSIRSAQRIHLPRSRRRSGLPSGTPEKLSCSAFPSASTQAIVNTRRPSLSPMR